MLQGSPGAQDNCKGLQGHLSRCAQIQQCKTIKDIGALMIQQGATAAAAATTTTLSTATSTATSTAAATTTTLSTVSHKVHKMQDKLQGHLPHLNML